MTDAGKAHGQNCGIIDKADKRNEVGYQINLIENIVIFQYCGHHGRNGRNGQGNSTYSL